MASVTIAMPLRQAWRCSRFVCSCLPRHPRSLLQGCTKTQKRLESTLEPRHGSVRNGLAAQSVQRPSTLRSLLDSFKKVSSDASQGSEKSRVLAFVRTLRHHRNVTFLTLDDGSIRAGDTLQAVLRHTTLDEKAKQSIMRKLSPGAAVEAVGSMEQSTGRGQAVEFLIEHITVTGQCDASAYPVPLSVPHAKGSEASQGVVSPDLRRYSHLRPREARHAAILKVRSDMERGMDQFFADRDFVRVAAPIITSSDCEGGGEVFTVLSEAGGRNQRFWGDSNAYLTVSAQLHLEAMALGLGRVYTTGPCFRAEGSATNRHLAEFWMCEGEQMTSNDRHMALDEVTDTVEGLVRGAIQAAFARQSADALWQHDKTGLAEVYQCVESSNRWPRLTYTQAVDLLQNVAKQGTNTNEADEEVLSIPPPRWGESFASKHERWLARHGPVFISHYPAEVKPFYMLLDVDGDAMPAEGTEPEQMTVSCFDLLVPRVGELVGGSLRETRPAVLQHRIRGTAEWNDLPNVNGQTFGADQADSKDQERHHLAWYTDDLRRFGCNPHGGFGLGIERLLAWITGTDSVRDVVTFPRAKGKLRY